MSGMRCGAAAPSPPVTSITPMIAPLAGSCTGAAVQLHGCTARAKCSAPSTCRAWSRASALPGALVPTARSDQSMPARKPISSARPRSARSPSTHSRRPAASPTATMNPDSSASSSSSRLTTGSTLPMGCVASTSRSSSSPSDGRSGMPSGSTVSRCARSQESSTTGRTAETREKRSRNSGSTAPSDAPSSTNRSCARSISRRRSSADSPRRRAFQPFVIPTPSSRPRMPRAYPTGAPRRRSYAPCPLR